MIPDATFVPIVQKLAAQGELERQQALLHTTKIKVPTFTGTTT